MYTIDPMMTFGEVVLCYENYAKDARRHGERPVSFLRFITGRY